MSSDHSVKYEKLSVMTIIEIKTASQLFLRMNGLVADEWLSGKGVRLSILDIVHDTSSIPSSANKFNVSGLR